MAYIRTIEITDISVALHNRPGQEVTPRLRANITETLRDDSGSIVPYPETRTAIMLAEDLTDDLMLAINVAIEYAGVRLVRIEDGNG